MKKGIILFLTASLFFQGAAFAEDKTSAQDKFIGSTFKTLAKAFIVMSDIDRLKTDNIARIEKMDDAKFRKEYAKFYAVMWDLPQRLKAEYKISENMSKAQAAKWIESLDKKRSYELIDSMQDATIADEFKKYLRENKEEMRKGNLAQQINNLWQKIKSKVYSY
ncbi:MAG: hypothetical protein HY589_05045 [Candidatus Omnitrophica bacterium]|nr:hypothetical protein [Candidatus Omnitrophota bacterium]